RIEQVDADGPRAERLEQRILLRRSRHAGDLVPRGHESRHHPPAEDAGRSRYEHPHLVLLSARQQSGYYISGLWRSTAGGRMTRERVGGTGRSVESIDPGDGVAVGEGLARTPDPPYWAVIFSTHRDGQPGDRYDQTAQKMLMLAAQRAGFLGVET